MNFVGKIFVGLIALMSIICFSLVLVLYASHQNWKVESETLAKKVQEEQDKNSQLTKMKGDLEAKNVSLELAHRHAVAAITTETQALINQNKDLQEERDRLTVEMRKYVDTMSVSQNTLLQMQADTDKLFGELQTAQDARNGYLRSLTETTSNFHEVSINLNELKEQNEALLHDFGKAKNVLTQFGLEATPELYGTLPPFPVEGIVKEVRQDKGNTMVLVSLGSDDGLTPHHMLEVYRDVNYLGRVEVVTVEPNLAVCKVLNQYRKGTIQEGDSVTSQFKK